MTLTIDLPVELASRLMALLPEGSREHFAVSAIAEALLAQERDTTECVTAVEEALAEMETGQSISLEDERERWQLQKAVLLGTASASAR